MVETLNERDTHADVELGLKLAAQLQQKPLLFDESPLGLFFKRGVLRLRVIGEPGFNVVFLKQT